MTLKTARKRAQQMAKRCDYEKSWYVILNNENGRYRAVPQETLIFLLDVWDLDMDIIEEY